MRLLIILRKQRRAENEARARMEAEQRRKRHARLRMLLAAFVAARERRRVVERAEGGWRGSTLHGYLESGDDITYSKKFRVTKATMLHIRDKLSASDFVVDNKCKMGERRVTALFKVAVCMYFLAHGCGDYDMVADVASIGKSTVEKYLGQFVDGVLTVLRPIYMPATPPSAAHLERIRSEFAGRRGIGGVAMAVDGTHVPFRGNFDYRNYKGWTSILAVAFVNSFHLFVDADVGHAGRAGDNGVLASSWILQQINADPEAWLGKDGVIAADGGASDGGELLINPIPDARTAEDQWYNFCHSSTRFFVEEVFGRWKNRFRFLLRELHLDHKTATRLIYVSMVLHNLCTIRKDDAVDFKEGADEEWQAFFDTYAREACPSCTRSKAMHCPHIAKWRGAAPAVGATAKAKRDAIRDALWAEAGADGSAVAELAAMEARAQAACGI